MNSIVISIGGLNVHYLGCYGSPWLETPELNRFAVESWIFDQMFVESPDPRATRLAWWSGCYQYSHRKPEQPDTTSLMPILRSHGVRTILVRDSATLVGSHDMHIAGFDQVIEIERGDEESSEALFQAARLWLEREADSGPFLLFIDAHGAHPPWFPMELDSSGEADEVDDETDELDALGVDSADDLEETSEQEDAEPHLELAWTSYLDSVAYLDQQLGSFLDFLRSRDDWISSLIVVTSDTGVAVQKSSGLDVDPHLLRDSLTHLPLLIRTPGGSHDPSRCPAIVQPIDILPTVLDASGIAISPDLDGRSLLPLLRQQSVQVREFARLTVPGRETGIRTVCWFLVMATDVPDRDRPSTPRLFAKPEDRWERDDVSRQFPQVVQDLENKLAGTNSDPLTV